jgi:hypothetical protein
MHQVDELLDDLGLGIGPVQRFMEWQMPVKPGKYARVAKELHRRLETPQARLGKAALA